jgi:hypothetical protein
MGLLCKMPVSSCLQLVALPFPLRPSCGVVPFRCFAHRGDRAGFLSRENLDRTAERKTEVTVRAPQIDPFEFSYQNATPGGRSLKVLARSNTRPAAVSLASDDNMAAVTPIMALPKSSTYTISKRSSGQSERRCAPSWHGRPGGGSPRASMAATGAKRSRP